MNHVVKEVTCKEVIHVDMETGDCQFPDSYPAEKPGERAPYAWRGPVSEHEPPNDVLPTINSNNLTKLPERMCREIEECRRDVVLE
jgi:hypothetical protein